MGALLCESFGGRTDRTPPTFAPRLRQGSGGSCVDWLVPHSNGSTSLRQERPGRVETRRLLGDGAEPLDDALALPGGRGRGVDVALGEGDRRGG